MEGCMGGRMSLQGCMWATARGATHAGGCPRRRWCAGRPHEKGGGGRFRNVCAPGHELPLSAPSWAPRRQRAPSRCGLGEGGGCTGSKASKEHAWRGRAQLRGWGHSARHGACLTLRLAIDLDVKEHLLAVAGVGPSGAAARAWGSVAGSRRVVPCCPSDHHGAATTSCHGRDPTLWVTSAFFLACTAPQAASTHTAAIVTNRIVISLISIVSSVVRNVSGWQRGSRCRQVPGPAPVRGSSTSERTPQAVDGWLLHATTGAPPQRPAPSPAPRYSQPPRVPAGCVTKTKGWQCGSVQQAAHQGQCCTVRWDQETVDQAETGRRAGLCVCKRVHACAAEESRSLQGWSALDSAGARAARRGAAHGFAADEAARRMRAASAQVRPDAEGGGARAGEFAPAPTALQMLVGRVGARAPGVRLRC